MCVCGRKDRLEKGKPINVFEAVKGSVTAREAAERYGIKVNRNGLARCPFHDDRTPSMKLDKRYYCFGCQASGDVIDLTARLFNIPARDAAMKLAHDFNISYNREKRPPISTSKTAEPKISASEPVHEEESGEREFLDDVGRCACVLLDYQSLLKRWRVEYAPADGEDEWHPLFTEALQEETHVEYLLDVLMNGSRADIADLIADKKNRRNGKENISV